ncbi:MAG TPA: putative zinc-binding metallopeptidase [Candidatus Manganitrophaceae bacterium]|nr:putative zinc-binding metallopeptidase [Candidatus Manganitrophaceae bacterium]
MKVFHCDHCQQLIFFENTRCVRCDRVLAYLPGLGVMGSLDDAGENLWRSSLPQAEGKRYRLCENYSKENVCNWGIPADDPHPLCPSCRLTEVIPDLSRPGHKEAWSKLEAAKRRLVYTLALLGCPIQNRRDDPEHGLAYRFLADPDTPGAAPVLTGHADGVITLNVVEADDAERERRRLQLHEPYRTLLGHFRHEAGHYYWDRLIRNSPRLEPFRKQFGDERKDYTESLQEHYRKGPPADWQQRWVSAYAAAHPWEDWAETWAHYLHMADTLETAVACGLSLRPGRPNEPALKGAPSPEAGSFDQLIDNWFPLTYVLNNLNRGLGLPDAYPFVLSTPAIDKLRFVHETIRATSTGAIS